MQIKKTIEFNHNLLLIIAGIVAILSCISTFADEADYQATYQATKSGNVIQIHTPEGTRLFFGDSAFGNLKNYRFEIPLSAFPAGNSHGGGNANSSGSGNSKPVPGPSLNDDLNQLFRHANQLYLSGNLDASLEFVKEILKRDPKNSRALVMRGSLYHAAGDHESAKKTWEQALELDPKNTSLKNIVEKYR